MGPPAPSPPRAGAAAAPANASAEGGGGSPPPPPYSPPPRSPTAEEQIRPPSYLPAPLLPQAAGFDDFPGYEFGDNGGGGGGGASSAREEAVRTTPARGRGASSPANSPPYQSPNPGTATPSASTSSSSLVSGGVGGTGSLPHRPRSAVFRPELHELTPVIRNTTSDEEDDPLARIVSPAVGGADAEAEEERRRRQLLSLSVPDSGSSSLLSQLPPSTFSSSVPKAPLGQRAFRPLPLALPGSQGGHTRLRMEMLNPPRASVGGLILSNRIGAAQPVPPVDNENVCPSIPQPPPAVRSRSAGNLDTSSLVKTYREHMARERSARRIGAEGGDSDSGRGSYTEEEGGDGGDVPGDLPADESLDRSYQSLRCTAPGLLPRDGDGNDIFAPSQVDPLCLRRPYQPLRKNSFEVGVKNLESEALDSIFQRGPTPRANGGGGGGGMTKGDPGQCRPPLSSGTSMSPPRGSAIPLNERDWSIPSLRMANRLRDSSASTSFQSFATYSEDDYTEEDNLYRDDEDDDDASLSTRGSLDVSYTSVGGETGHHQSAAVDISRVPSSSSGPVAVGSAPAGKTAEGQARCQVIIGRGSIDRVKHRSLDSRTTAASESDAAVVEDEEEENLSSDFPIEQKEGSNDIIPPQQQQRGSPLPPGVDPKTKKKKKKKQPKKVEMERSAIEWLRTVEAEGISEAASSKFLTGGTNGVRHPPAAAAREPLLHRPYNVNRQFSSPEHVSMSVVSALEAPSKDATRSTLPIATQVAVVGTARALP